MIIVGNPANKARFILNLGRPDFTEEPHFVWWEYVFDLLETDPILIVGNGAYEAMREMCKNRTLYMGGGFKFEFGFFTEEDRASIIEKLRNHGAKIYDEWHLRTEEE